jgi:transmembrane sensor
VVVEFSSARRLVDLQYGRANFRVAPDNKRPFAVQVADHTVIVNRSIFDVRRDGNRVSVVLIQGHATVRSQAPRGSNMPGTISDGERLVQVSGEVARVDKPNLLPLLAWQTGQAIFENESLAQAVYELNRYSDVKLTIADPSIANLKVSGVYRVGDNATFARAVAKLLPLTVSQQDDHIDLVADPARTPSG